MLVILTFCVGLSGCTPTEDDLLADLQNALTTLLQNKELAEQGVRDIKAGVKPSDPNYALAMDDYQKARDQYGQYLDTVEQDRHGRHGGAARGVYAGDVQTTTTDFISDVAAALNPGVNPRAIMRDRTIRVPDDLQATLHKLSKKHRERLVDSFDRQVRWKAWSDLQ
jgi:hypothetical protein